MRYHVTLSFPSKKVTFSVNQPSRERAIAAAVGHYFNNRKEYFTPKELQKKKVFWIRWFRNHKDDCTLKALDAPKTEEIPAISHESGKRKFEQLRLKLQDDYSS